MSAALDIILVVIIAGAIINGFRKGLVKSAIELVGGIVALALAFNFATPVGQYIGSNFLAPSMKKALVGDFAKTASVIPTNDVNSDIKKLDIEKLLNHPTIKTVLSGFGVTTEKVLTNNAASKLTSTVEQYKINMIDSIVNPVANSVGAVIAFLLIFIISLILIKLISFFIGFITKIPVIQQFDKVGGLLFGIVNGVFVIIVLCAALKLVQPYIQKEGSSAINDTTIQNTVVFKYFYDINPFKLNIKI